METGRLGEAAVPANISLTDIRPIGGDQRHGFEKLCCQLAEHEPQSEGSEFVPKGSPDAGVECFLRYADGTEHGWQAKFFTSAQDIDWRQVDSSVRTALHRHPNLTDYTVCFATDLPDARVPGRRSAREHWETHVEKWKRWAEEADMSVEFHFWGEHEIIERLSRPAHRGRLFFWFECPDLTPEWFGRHVRRAIASSQERYFPEVDVGLEIDEALESLAYNSSFGDRLHALASDLRKSGHRIVTPSAPDSVADALRDLSASSETLADELESLATGPWSPFPWRRLIRDSEEIATSASEIWSQIDRMASASEGESNDRAHQREYGYVRHHLRNLLGDAQEIQRFLGRQGHIAGIRGLLIVGEAGTGKTHLFCKTAEKRGEAGLPTLILLGAWYEGGDPWQWVIGETGLRCDREQLLGALQAAAEAYDSRAIILVDALNEGKWVGNWSNRLVSFVSELAPYDRLCVAVSVRSTYESHIVPEHLVDDHLVRIEHTGFAGNEYEAVRRYFHHFQIPLPRVPLEFHELANPLFLRLLCKAIADSGQDHIPDGVRGLTAVFDYFISSVDDVLHRPENLDYPRDEALVKQAIDAIATLMVEATASVIPGDEAQQAVEAIRPSQEYSGSLFAQLLHWGILTQTPIYLPESEEATEGIRFAFERFSDHQIAALLIGNHVDRHNPEAAFAPSEPLGRLVRGEIAFWAQETLVDAIAIQMPELVAQELPDLVPDVREDWHLRHAFIVSLVWRSPTAFSEATDAYINEVLFTHEDSFEHLLDALLMVAADPEHPLNADRTHRFLSRYELPKRDALWSTYLHYHFDTQGAVDRLLDWALDYEDSNHPDDEVLRLAGTALAWYLTSPNRTLRDRTTNALVNVFDGRIHVLPAVIDAFLDVDDPYVIERLFAVAYGCVMRTDDQAALGRLAQCVFDWVFADGRPYVHIHTRDYARGVVRAALDRGCSLTGDMALADPPYSSDWPGEIPTEEELEPLGEVSEDMPEEERARGRLHFSVMEWDFARYVIGTNWNSFPWTSIPIDEPKPQLPDQVSGSFFEQLDDAQREAWQEYEGALCLRRLIPLSPDDRDLLSEDALACLPQDEQEAQALVDQALTKFRGTLDADHVAIFDDVVLPYKTNQEPLDVDFDLPLVQRFILARVFELGWSRELHGHFDWWTAMAYPPTRFEHATERIGKKYQWIAYHEILARISDNFHLRGDMSSDYADIYEGPWQVSHGRDIDPSCLLTVDHSDDFYAHSNTWWFTVNCDPWDDPRSHEDWLRDEGNIPDPGELLESGAQADGETWLALNGYYLWGRERSESDDGPDLPRREIWYKLWSYLVPEDADDDIWDWLVGQRIFQYTLPEPADFINHIFLGEFHWAPAYRFRLKSYFGHENPFSVEAGSNTVQVAHTAERYLRESAGFDHSVEEPIGLVLPASPLADILGIRRNLCDGRFTDDTGEVIAQDPSAYEAGPSVLLTRRDRLVEGLRARDLSLLWIAFGEKNVYHPLPDRPRRSLGRLEIGACYLLRPDGIRSHLDTRFVEPGEQ